VRLWELDGWDQQIVEITRSGARRATRPGVLLHHSEDLARADVLRRQSIPVTSPSRTLIDAAAVLPAETLEAVFESALRARLTSIPKLANRLQALGGPGRSGSATLWSLIRERDPTQAPTDSLLETRTYRLLVQRGLPSPRRQYPLSWPDGFRVLIDLAYPERLVAIEDQSFKHHSGRASWELDVEKRQRLEDDGWIVIYVTWSDATERPDLVAARVRRALRSRGWLPRAPA
jgi:hypothetical protein